MPIQLETLAYGGWPHVLRLSNGQAELLLTLDVGPRIIRFGFIGGENQFGELLPHMGQVGGDEWRLYGGHRLWLAPEIKPITYAPDNAPVSHQALPGGVRLSQHDSVFGIEKQLEVYLDEDQNTVRILHRIRNIGHHTHHIAPWALTVMRTGGVGILPMPPHGSHAENLLPVSSLHLWAYTDFSDPRWRFGRDYICLQQDPHNEVAQKVGAALPQSWLAHWHAGTLFIKRSDFAPAATYPDRGSNLELFTNHLILELESLGPLVHLLPGTSVEHLERWGLYANIPAPASDQAIRHHIEPLANNL